MKQCDKKSLLTLCLGAAGMSLRLLQNMTGFEPGTGLPIPGSIPGILLPVLLALLLRAMYGAVDLPNVGKFATVFSQFFGLYCRHEIVILSERQISLLGENYNGKTDIADGGFIEKIRLTPQGCMLFV